MTDEYLHPMSAGGGDTYAAAAPITQNNVAASDADPFSGYENYYSFDKTELWYFPDGKQWIKFQKLNEGARAKYLNATRSDVKLDQKSGMATIPFDQSKDRKELLLASIVDWHIVMPTAHGMQLVPFQPVSMGGKGGVVSQWIDRQDPQILGSLEKAIRKCNPWLLNEMSVEQIDKEIADLQELRVKAAEREAEEGNFGAR